MDKNLFGNEDNNCICGNNDINKFKHYDGSIGYEAYVCKICHAIHDYNGIHKADSWSKDFINNSIGEK